MTTTTLQISRVEIERLPHYRKQTNAGEYSAACPFCGEGEDRFRFWPEENNFWCRVCGAKGFVSDINSIQFDPVAYEEWKCKQAERQRQEELSQLSTLERLNQNNNVTRYYQNLIDRSFWYEYGLSDHTIDAYKLGYTSICPTYPESASYTIPIYFQDKLYNIRHRLIKPNGSGKYRPEMAGLPSAIFNADILADDLNWFSEIVIVEGEIKALIVQQMGFGSVGIPGANIFKEKWVKLFANKNVYIALDPGVEAQGERIWRMLGQAGIRVHLCTFPVKPDDFFVKYGGTASDFFEFLRLGKPFNCE